VLKSNSHAEIHHSFSESQSKNGIVILIPVFNDWDAVSLLLTQLDHELKELRKPVHIILIDDGSSESIPDQFGIHLSSIQSIHVLTLRRNLGHQRALAIGLSFVEANIHFDALVVMDGDGEDAPGDVKKLLSRFESEGYKHIVFAERTLRSEGLTFRVFYRIYRVLHRLLTGIQVRVGNFSVVPPSVLSRLVVVSELWNHYPASVFKARLPYVMEKTVRGKRLAGESRLNFVGLVAHGLSAISVFGDRVGVRLLVATSAFIFLVLFLLAMIPLIRFGTDLAIPGWATTAFGILLLLLTQMLMLSLVFSFIVLGARDVSSFLPIRDHHYFINRFEEVQTFDGRLRLSRK
jgi:polyisoprenyl-phosphate glycosyltransferase